MKSLLTDHFDRVYVIGLPYMEDRRERLAVPGRGHFHPRAEDHFILHIAARDDATRRSVFEAVNRSWSS